jgi:hypothetical protein
MKKGECRVRNEPDVRPISHSAEFSFCIPHFALCIRKSLPPVLPRRDFLTKEACRLPQGGEMVAVSSAALDTAGL